MTDLNAKCDAKTSPVEIVLNNLDGNIGKSHELLAILRDRLSPVLRPANPASISAAVPLSKDGIETEPSEHVKVLRAYDGHISDLGIGITDLLNRLDV